MGGKQERLIRLAKVQFINKPSIKLWNVSWPRELIVNSSSEQFSIGLCDAGQFLGYQGAQ